MEGVGDALRRSEEIVGHSSPNSSTGINDTRRSNEAVANSTTNCDNQLPSVAWEKRQPNRHQRAVTIKKLPVKESHVFLQTDSISSKSSALVVAAAAAEAAEGTIIHENLTPSSTGTTMTVAEEGRAAGRPPDTQPSSTCSSPNNSIHTTQKPVHQPTRGPGVPCSGSAGTENKPLEIDADERGYVLVAVDDTREGHDAAAQSPVSASRADNEKQHEQLNLDRFPGVIFPTSTSELLASIVGTGGRPHEARLSSGTTAASTSSSLRSLDVSTDGLDWSEAFDADSESVSVKYRR